MSGSAKIQCLDDLRNRILSLDIAPGSDLDELRLCDHYGISRTPLREVLQRLAGEGFSHWPTIAAQKLPRWISA